MQRHTPFVPGTLKAELLHFMLMALQYQTSTNDIAQGLPNEFLDFIIKNCPPICTAHLSPNQQPELEWLQICFCGDISQITMGVVEVHYRVPLHYLTVFPKKKKNHRKKICYCCFILCFFARGLTDLCLKLPARKDEHRYTKLPGALGMQTKFLGFQVFHWKVYHSRMIWISTGMSTICISTPPSCIQGCYRFDIG